MVTKGFLADALSVSSPILHSHGVPPSHQWTLYLSLSLFTTVQYPPYYDGIPFGKHTFKQAVVTESQAEKLGNPLTSSHNFMKSAS